MRLQTWIHATTATCYSLLPLSVQRPPFDTDESDATTHVRPDAIVMWFRVEPNFLGKRIHKNDRHCVLISDFKYVWFRYITDADLLSTSQELNPLFDTSQDKLRELTLKLFDHNESNIKREVSNENSDLILRLEDVTRRLRYRFQVTLKRGDEELLYNEFTLPLLHALTKLEKSETSLMKIIDDKNSKIEELKLEIGHTEKDDPKKKAQPQAEEAEVRSKDTNELYQKQFLNCMKDLRFQHEFVPGRVDQSLSGGDDSQSNRHVPGSLKRQHSNESTWTRNVNGGVKVNHQIVKKTRRQNRIL